MIQDIFAGYKYDYIVYMCKTLLDKYRAKGYIIESNICKSEFGSGCIYIEFIKFEWIDTLNPPPSYEDSYKDFKLNTKQKTIII